MGTDKTRSYKWAVLLTTSIGMFMTPFDGTVVSVSLPSIAEGLKMSYDLAIWVPTAYLVVLAVLLLSMGRLSDIIGRKPIFITGFAVFVASSLLCSLASSGTELIAFRAIQGTGAACMGATSTAIVTNTFPSKERGKALGINTMSAYVGLAVGPSLGGFLTFAFGWQSIFYVNIPIGLLVIVLALAELKESPPQGTGKRFDLLGTVKFSAGMVSLLVGLTLGDGLGWGSPIIIGLLAASGLLFISFLATEGKRGSGAMLDLSLFTRNRLFAAANLSALLNYTSFFGVTFFVSFYIQRIMGYDPLRTGFVLLVLPVTMALLSPISGWLSDRFGSRGFSSLGMGLIALGLLMLSTLSASSTPYQVISGLLVMGLGMGLFSSPNTSAVMGSVAKDNLGIASGTLGTMRFSGQALSLALMGALVASASSTGLLSSLITGVGISHLSIAPGEFVDGMKRAFLVSAGVSMIGVFTSLLRGSKKQAGQGM